MDETKEIQFQDRGEKALTYVNALQVVSEQGKESATLFLKRIGEVEKEIDEYFGPSITKAKDIHKDLLDKKRKFTEPLKRAKEILKDKLLAYKKKQDAERQEAIKKAEEESQAAQAAAKKDPLSSPSPPATVVPEETKIDGFHTRVDWKWRVVDFDKIPREFLITDDVKINKAVRNLKQDTSIPGIEVYKEESISKSRGKKDPY